MSKRVHYILQSLSIKDLRQLSGEFGFPATGNQATLIQRLLTGPKIIEDNLIFSEAKNLTPKIPKQIGGADLEKLKIKYLSKLAQKYQENVTSNIETDKQLTNDALFNLFVEADPSTNHKYTDWLISGYINNGIKRLEDLQSRALPGLKNYEHLLRKKILKHVKPEQYWTDERNILNYLGLVGGPFKNRQYPGLEDILEKYQSELEKIHGTRIQRTEARSEAKLVFWNDLVDVYQPLTEAAACYYGQGTRWCTAGREHNKFADYSDEGPIKIIIPKQPEYPGEKYQFQHETEQYMNEKDEDMAAIPLFKRYQMEYELTKVPIWIHGLNDPKLKQYSDNPIKIGQGSSELTYIPDWIFEVNRRRLIGLYFDGNQIVIIPPKIGQLTNLQALSFKHNYLIQIIPREIGQLTNLKELHLNGNQIQRIPPEIGQLINLKTLNLRNNKISKIPSHVGQLTNLKYLDLGNNEIRVIPSEIFRLANLKYLNLDGNYIEAIPPQIEHLTKLEQLLLSINQIKSIPPEIGQLTNLIHLDLGNDIREKAHPHGNQIEIIPAEIGKLTNLTGLSFSRNQIEIIPAEIGQLTKLEQLNLHNNEITVIPPEIFQLTNLKRLSIRGNPLHMTSELTATLKKLKNIDFS